MLIEVGETMKLLITAGSTKEFIDSVRYISNISTGQTGLFLAQAFVQFHQKVTLLIASDVSIPDEIKESTVVIPFTTYRDLQRALSSQLSLNHFDAVIHLAAVGDYCISDILMEDHRITRMQSVKKITACQSLTLKLKQNPKLLPQLKALSQNKSILVAGFKLTDTNNVQEETNQIKEILYCDTVDIVVHNRLSEIKGEKHKAEIYKNKKLFQKVESKKELAESLFKTMESHE